MLKNYFTTTIRNIARNLSHTVINITGLVLGITGAVIVYLITTYLLSYDRYHQHADNIYRIVAESKLSTGVEYGSGVPLLFPDAFKTDFPEVEEVAFVSYKRVGLITVPKVNQAETFDEHAGIAYITPEFYRTFDRQFISGDVTTAWKDPNSVVLSKRYALKYFNSLDVLGKTINLDNKYDLLITGVIEDFPSNSHFPFDVLISYATARKELEVYSHWANTSSDDQCYILLPSLIDAEEINSRLKTFSEKHSVVKLTGRDRTFFLQPLKDLQFDSRFGNYLYMTVGWSSILLMIIVGVFLVVTAVVNFINLSTAVAVTRAKEVGIRKVVGGNRLQLILQFLGETFVVTSLSLIVSMCLVELVTVQFINPFLNVSLFHKLFSDVKLILFLLGVLILITVAAGFYPAFLLSGFKPAQAINRTISSSVGGFSLRKILVVFQFVISQVFIIGTVTMIAQMNYLKSYDVGFKRDAVLVVSLPEGDSKNAFAFYNKVKNYQGINMISLSSTAPSSGSISVTGIHRPKDAQTYDFQYKAIDENYIDLYNIPLIAGKNIYEEDTFRTVLVNRALVKHLGFNKPEEIIGERFEYENRSVHVAGVVADFNTTSLKNSIEPLFLAYRKDFFKLVSIELKKGDWKNTIKFIGQQWKTIYPDHNFEAEFLDDQLKGFYRGEQKLSQLFSVACFVSIFIGALGLYGLVLFMSKMKTKEIGIRKVHGASPFHIVNMFSVQFLKLLMVGFVLSAPIAWVSMNKFLETYTYKIDMDWKIFGVGFIVSVIITFLTIGFKAVQSSLVNPVNTLKAE